MTIERCQLILSDPIKYDEQTFYIQVGDLRVNPEKHPNCFFLLYREENEWDNSLSYKNKNAVEYYTVISDLLVDKDKYSQAIAEFQSVSVLQGGIEGLLGTAYRYLENSIHMMDHIFSLVAAYPNEPCGQPIYDYFLLHQMPEPNYLKHIESGIVEMARNKIYNAQILDYSQENMKRIICSIGWVPH